MNNPGEIPEVWFQGLVALIPKKERPEPLDHRPIALLSHIAKLWETSVKIMMDEAFDAEKLIAGYQGGFRYLRGIDTTSLTLEALGELCKAQGLPLIAVFLDIKKAFDSVPATVMAACLMRLKLPARLVKVLMAWISGHSRRLLVPGNELGAWLELLVGVPQGSVLAPFLFSCVMDSLHAYLRGEGGVLGLPALSPPLPALKVRTGDEWRDLMYADDSVLLAHYTKDAERALAAISKWSGASGLDFHPGKFATVRMGAPDSTNSDKFAPKSSTITQRKRLAGLKYEGSAIPVHSETKHLGLNVHSYKSSSTLTVSMSKRIESASASTSVLRFAFKPSPTAAVVRFTSALHSSVAEGCVYFC